MLINKDVLGDLYDIAEKLQTWLEEAWPKDYPADEAPQVEVSFIMYGAMIEIDGVDVWHSEADSDDDLNLDACQRRYLEHCSRIVRLYEAASAGR